MRPNSSTASAGIAKKERASHRADECRRGKRDDTYAHEAQHMTGCPNNSRTDVNIGQSGLPGRRAGGAVAAAVTLGSSNGCRGADLAIFPGI